MEMLLLSQQKREPSPNSAALSTITIHLLASTAFMFRKKKRKLMNYIMKGIKVRAVPVWITNNACVQWLLLHCAHYSRCAQFMRRRSEEGRTCIFQQA